MEAPEANQLSVARKGIASRGNHLQVHFWQKILWICPSSPEISSLSIPGAVPRMIPAHLPLPRSSSLLEFSYISEVRLLRIPSHFFSLLTYFPFLFFFWHTGVNCHLFLVQNKRKNKTIILAVELFSSFLIDYSELKSVRKAWYKAHLHTVTQKLPWRSNCHAEINGLVPKVQKNSTRVLHIFFSKLK